ncbi:MAG TPA: DUF4230 domain-containing protein [Flavobacteriaceae bacterium]|nr:DUF4230 domain-containing protein [Flavobacteriaceae bacterium]HIP26739.1 DUF4230 domain-containing protein [Flavobacteriaceae bacterium]
MKKLVSYLFVFIVGAIIAYFYFTNQQNKYKSEQVNVILTEIKNVSKLVVTESTFSEMYNYQDADKYFFETISFDKKVILSVNAKVQVSYDLSKMIIETDTIYKKITIKYLPKEEIFISPQISYFDLEQSSFNQFSKEELNEISKKSIAKIKETIDASTLKEESKNRLFIELKKIYTMANLLGWQLIDETENKTIRQTFKL